MGQLKGRGGDRLRQLKKEVEEKRRRVEEKKKRVLEIRGNVDRIARYAGERGCEGKYYVEVFKAFKGKLIEDQKASGTNL